MSSTNVRIQRDRDRTALTVDGVVQSIDVESADASDYWSAMLPDTRPDQTLLLGAGGGTLAAMLRRRFGPLPVIAVDIDPEVVRLGRASFYLAMPGVSIVLADAIQFVTWCSGRFDYIAVDLFRGNERPREVAGRPFLRGLRRIARPGATVVFNLFQDRRVDTTLTRIARVLAPVRQVSAGKNVVTHYRIR